MSPPPADSNEANSLDSGNISHEETSNLPSDEQSSVKRKKSLRQAIKEIYLEFCSNTSIHGFQYFGQQRPRKEIIFWVAIFIITIYFCTSIIAKIYIKWYETPVIVSFSEKSTPIWNIPFPRVTICPETKRAINKTDATFYENIERLATYIENGTFTANFSASEFEETLTLMHICSSGLGKYLDIPPASLPSIDYVANLNKMLPGFDKYFYTCEWFSNTTECNELFGRVYTDEGICYTFNSLRAEDLYSEEVMQDQMRSNDSDNHHESHDRPVNWSLETGYPEDSDLHTYPARVLSSGSTAGLHVYLQSFLSEVDYTCNGPIQGFKVMLHSPDDVPSVDKHFVRVSMDKEILIAVKPKMITTSEDIAAYHPDKRRCYMNKDRQLRFYKVYSQNNCERECLTNFTLSQCGCVRFSMPRTPDMPVCGEDKIACYLQAKQDLLVQQFSAGLKNAKSISEEVSSCNCMPACTSLEYEVEISEGNFDLVNTLKAYNSFDEYYDVYPGGKMSLLQIYFKENQFITSRRSELYGVTELLANFGGVFGLFMGISILSLVEMFYHCTLRLWSNMTRAVGGN